MLGDIARLNGKRYPDKKAVVMDDRHLTFGQLNRLSNQLAYGLVSEGVSPGDRVALLSYNCLEFVIVNYAVAKCGAILVPVNFRFKADELVYVVNNSEPRALVYGEELAGLVEEARALFVSPPKLISMGEKSSLAGPTIFGLMEGQSTEDPAIPVDPYSPACIIYTSGTTGFPKGVLSSHHALLSVNAGIIVEGDLDHKDVVLIPLPLFHSGGLNSMLQPALEMGATTVIMGKGFDPEKFLYSIEHYGATLTQCVPTQLAMLVNYPGARKHNVSSLKKMYYGSSAISETVLSQSGDLFKVGFYQWYGQTESGIVMTLRPEDHVEHADCTGREMFNAEIRVVDENGRDTPVGEIGEIVARYPGVGMIGYYRNEEATRRAVRDGWIHTEDLARVEGGGYYTIVDRLRDMINSGAENIYSKEIEDVIMAHPAVGEVAVLGIPDDLYGEAVCAVVVKKEGCQLDQKDLIDFCAAKLSGYKKPKQVDFADELPKNATGKITKNVLRDRYWAGRKKRV